MYERYCKLRDAKGLNDAQVADFCKFPKSTFSDWKKGKSEPKLPKITKIAECLECSIDYLVTGNERKFESEADILIYVRNDKELMESLKIYMNLSDKKKKLILDTIENLKEVEND